MTFYLKVQPIFLKTVESRAEACPYVMPLASARCDVPAEVRVGADAATAPALQSAAATVPAEACVTYTFETQTQPELAASVTAGKDAPDLWVADSAVRVQRVVTAAAPEITVDSLASTPGVIVGSPGEVPGFATWLSALQASGVGFSDPLVTGSGEVALLGALAEVEAGRAEAKALQAATAQLAQGENRRTGEKLTDAKQLEAVAFAGGFAIVTGSMNFQAGAQTRMQLTQQAAIAGSKLFPDTAALGMWAFSIGLGGGSQDYVELDPVRKMGEVVDGVTQRERLVADITGLDKRTGGATGLYDSTLAAYRTVKANYDARAVNSLILFADRANEDPDSLSLEELLETPERERDPAKPVVIVSIGITDDADAGTLRRISEATGGTSYVARNPQDIPNVFVDALQARAQ
jgi:hypothetical protein